MDVDAINTFQKKPEPTKGRPQFTDAQKEALKLLGACFRCGERGHQARNCQKYPQAPCPLKKEWSGGTNSQPRNPPSSTQIRAAETTEGAQISIQSINPTKFWKWAETQPEEERENIAQKILEMSGFP